jgi:hypothetical protein
MEAAASTKLATSIGGTKDPIKNHLVPPERLSTTKAGCEWNNNKRGGGEVVWGTWATASWSSLAGGEDGVLSAQDFFEGRALCDA